MRVVIAIALIVTGCSYSDPSLDGTRFKCPGGAACPSGQKCVGDFCVSATADGIACTTPCTAAQQCCDDGTNPPRCLAAGDSCLGVTAFCDGKEDCTGGDLCCAVGVVQQCAPPCSYIACQQPDDCPTNVPNCCADMTEPKPWKFCQLDPC